MNSALPPSYADVKRPALVWVILVLYALGLLYSLIALIAVFSGMIRLHGPDAAFYSGFGVWNFLGLLASTAIGLGFVIQLFRLHSSAVYLATAGLIVSVIKQLWYRPELTRLGHPAWPAVVGGLISLAVVSYVWHLKRIRVLR